VAVKTKRENGTELVLTEYGNDRFYTMLRDGSVSGVTSIDFMREHQLPDDKKGANEVMKNLTDIYKLYMMDPEQHLRQAVPGYGGV